MALAPGAPGRRVAHLQRGSGKAVVDWYVDLQDTASEDHAHNRVHATADATELPAVVDQNGGGWHLVGWLEEVPSA